MFVAACSRLVLFVTDLAHVGVISWCVGGGCCLLLFAGVCCWPTLAGLLGLLVFVCWCWLDLFVGVCCCVWLTSAACNYLAHDRVMCSDVLLFGAGCYCLSLVVAPGRVWGARCRLLLFSADVCCGLLLCVVLCCCVLLFGTAWCCA